LFQAALEAAAAVVGVGEPADDGSWVVVAEDRLDVGEVAGFAQVWNRFWNSQTQDGPILSSGLATEAGKGRGSACG
jgi:hypothetical protein